MRRSRANWLFHPNADSFAIHSNPRLTFTPVWSISPIIAPRATPTMEVGDTLFGKGLYPKPPDMRQKETQNKSDGELYYTIENAIRLSGMPAFGEEHAEAGDMETRNLVLFIRHLPN